MTQQTIRQEGAFTQDNRTAINNNFNELYGRTISNQGGIPAQTISIPRVTLAAVQAYCASVGIYQPSCVLSARDYGWRNQLCHAENGFL